MKFLLLLVVALAVVWAWRSNRPIRDQSEATRQPPAPPQPQDMARCAYCGVHVPKADAVAGRDGLYCGTEHQQRAET